MKSSKGFFLLSTAYFPPIEYFSAIARGERVLLESCESYIKQSYRNRCRIYATDGLLSLSIPIVKPLADDKITDVRIDYSTPWIQQHERAIISSYGQSPFFDYYRDEIFEIINSRQEHLFTLNKQLIDKMLELVGIENNILLTNEYIKQYPEEVLDLREAIHPKREPIQQQKPYYQVFADKQGFMSNLSIIDLLFNEGPESFSFL